MSDRTGASRPSRSGSVILSGLAVGAILSTPVAPAEAPAAGTEAVAAMGCGQPAGASETPVSAIREQFRTAFTAGAVTPPETDLPAIICDPNQQ